AHVRRVFGRRVCRVARHARAAVWGARGLARRERSDGCGAEHHARLLRRATTRLARWRRPRLRGPGWTRDDGHACARCRNGQASVAEAAERYGRPLLAARWKRRRGVAARVRVAVGDLPGPLRREGPRGTTHHGAGAAPGPRRRT